MTPLTSFESVHAAPFTHGDDSHSSMSTSQLPSGVPHTTYFDSSTPGVMYRLVVGERESAEVYPATQAQSYPMRWSVQLAPCWQGAEPHSSSSVQLKPAFSVV